MLVRHRCHKILQNGGHENEIFFDYTDPCRSSGRQHLQGHGTLRHADGRSPLHLSGGDRTVKVNRRIVLSRIDKLLKAADWDTLILILDELEA